MELVSLGLNKQVGRVSPWFNGTPFRLDPSSLDALTGEDGTFTRATIATVEDHEGVIRSVLSGEVRYQGQRRVENLAPASEDLTSAAWTVADTASNSTEAATTIELTAIDSGYHIKNITPDGDINGRDFVMSADIAWISGETIVNVRGFNTGTVVSDNANIDLSDLTTKRVSVNITAGSDGNIRFGIDNRAISGASNTGVTKVTFTNIQIQEKTGASDPTIPDSYVSTGVLSAPYHGAGVDGVAYLLTTNGNTVSANIVTEAAGSPITGAIGYLGEVASTNKCTNYNANPDSGAVADGTLAAFNAAGVTNVDASGGDGSSLYGVVADTVKLATGGLDGACTSGYVLHIDNTGSATRAVFNFQGAANANAHSLSAQCRGDGSLHLSGRYGTSKQTFSSTEYAKVTHQDTNNTSISSLSVESGDEAWIILNQLEELAFSTSEIIVEGAAATRNKDELSYPTTNIPVNDCVFSFDWTPTAAGQGTVVLFGSGDAADHTTVYVTGSIFYARKTISSVNYLATKTTTYAVGTTYSVKVRFDTINGITIWVDNVSGTDHANTTDAIYGSNIYIGSYYDASLTQTGGIDNFTVHKGSFSDAEVLAL